jgi:hypothetical protein
MLPFDSIIQSRSSHCVVFGLALASVGPVLITGANSGVVSFAAIHHFFAPAHRRHAQSDLLPPAIYHTTGPSRVDPLRSLTHVYLSDAKRVKMRVADTASSPSNEATSAFTWVSALARPRSPYSLCCLREKIGIAHA